MEEEVVNKKAEEDKKKKRTSLKSILGGDILATDFPPSNEVAGTYHGIHHLLHSQSLCQSTATDRNRPAEKGIDSIKYDALTRSSELMESRQS